jgi:hypothetical protein
MRAGMTGFVNWIGYPALYSKIGESIPRTAILQKGLLMKINRILKMNNGLVSQNPSQHQARQALYRIFIQLKSPRIQVQPRAVVDLNKDVLYYLSDKRNSILTLLPWSVPAQLTVQSAGGSTRKRKARRNAKYTKTRKPTRH